MAKTDEREMAPHLLVVIDHQEAKVYRTEVHGLDVVVVEPGFLLTVAVCFARGVSGHRTQDHVFELRLLPQTLGNLIAVHPRQTDVQ